jgi:hypothetical protein
MLPPLNIHAPLFWSFFIMVSIIVLSIYFVPSKDFTFKDLKKVKYVAIIPIIFVLIFIINLTYVPLFRASTYHERIVITDSSFTEDVKPVDYTQLPLLDKDSSQKLGDRTMGTIPELVSQFYVSDLYTQINYQNKIIRVTPLEYNSFIKWMTNRSDGVQGYIEVNSVNGESQLHKLDEGMKYMPSGYFNDNLERKLRFSYPTKIFGEITFEIDNEGNPYWIVPVMSYKGVGLLADVNELIILDPITGDSDIYAVADVPTWVDHVYPSSLIISQTNDWGMFVEGFFNSIFVQKNVVQTTTGYNYIAQDDDIYLYTGITSITSDESNLGFILTNLRTKETNFYEVPGAEEYSAMSSAKGQVQQMNYTSTFPLLINLEDKPTYLVSLKDNAGLVKMYALVDVKDYQKVVVTDANEGIEQASINYLNNKQVDISELEEKEITIKSLTPIVIDGNTYYFIEAEDNYKVKVSLNLDVIPYLKVNDQVNITYNKLNEITKIEK